MNTNIGFLQHKCKVLLCNRLITFVHISMVSIGTFFIEPSIATTDSTLPSHNNTTHVTSDNAIRNELLTRINTIQKQIEEKQLASDKLAMQLRTSEQQRMEITTALAQGRATHQQYTKALEKLRAQNFDLQRIALQQNTLLAQLLQQSYRRHSYSPLRIALEIPNKRDWSRHLTYLQYLLAYRASLTKKAVQNSQHQQRLITKQQQLIDQIQQQNRTLAINLSRLKAVEQQRNQILNRIRKQITTQDDELATYQQSAQRLEKIATSIGQLQLDEFVLPNRFITMRGNLSLPIDSNKLNKKNIRFMEKKDGIFVFVPSGTPVISIAPGQVVYANWIKGLGMVVIIDHADEYLSLYAHNQRIVVQVGEWVTQNTIISYVGDSGGRTQSGLFMQILHKGKSVSLRRWFKKQLFAQLDENTLLTTQ